MAPGVDLAAALPEVVEEVVVSAQEAECQGASEVVAVGEVAVVMVARDIQGTLCTCSAGLQHITIRSGWQTLREHAGFFGAGSQLASGLLMHQSLQSSNSVSKA